MKGALNISYKTLNNKQNNKTKNCDYKNRTNDKTEKITKDQNSNENTSTEKSNNCRMSPDKME